MATNESIISAFEDFYIRYSNKIIIYNDNNYTYISCEGITVDRYYIDKIMEFSNKSNSKVNILSYDSITLIKLEVSNLFTILRDNNILYDLVEKCFYFNFDTPKKLYENIRNKNITLQNTTKGARLCLDGYIKNSKLVNLKYTLHRCGVHDYNIDREYGIIALYDNDVFNLFDDSNIKDITTDHHKNCIHGYLNSRYKKKKTNESVSKFKELLIRNNINIIDYIPRKFLVNSIEDKKEVEINQIKTSKKHRAIELRILREFLKFTKDYSITINVSEWTISAYKDFVDLYDKFTAEKSEDKNYIDEAKKILNDSNIYNKKYKDISFREITLDKLSKEISDSKTISNTNNVDKNVTESVSPYDEVPKKKHEQQPVKINNKKFIPVEKNNMTLDEYKKYCVDLIHTYNWKNMLKIIREGDELMSPFEILDGKIIPFEPDSVSEDGKNCMFNGETMKIKEFNDKYNRLYTNFMRLRDLRIGLDKKNRLYTTSWLMDKGNRASPDKKRILSENRMVDFCDDSFMGGKFNPDSFWDGKFVIYRMSNQFDYSTDIESAMQTECLLRCNFDFESEEFNKLFNSMLNGNKKEYAIELVKSIKDAGFDLDSYYEYLSTIYGERFKAQYKMNINKRYEYFISFYGISEDFHDVFDVI